MRLRLPEQPRQRKPQQFLSFSRLPSAEAGSMTLTNRFDHLFVVAAGVEPRSFVFAVARRFRYNKEIDPKGIPEFGLVAEDVEQVNPNLVVRDAKGEVYIVRYDAVKAMLLNEFLKGHRKVQELEKQVEKLTAGLQKVSAQVEMSRPTSQVVVSKQ